MYAIYGKLIFFLIYFNILIWQYKKNKYLKWIIINFNSLSI